MTEDELDAVDHALTRVRRQMEKHGVPRTT